MTQLLTRLRALGRPSGQELRRRCPQQDQCRQGKESCQFHHIHGSSALRFSKTRLHFPEKGCKPAPGTIGLSLWDLGDFRGRYFNSCILGSGSSNFQDDNSHGQLLLEVRKIYRTVPNGLGRPVSILDFV